VSIRFSNGDAKLRATYQHTAASHQYMTTPPASRSQLDSSTCERCHRWYLAVGDQREDASTEAGEPSRCLCGGELRAGKLPAGIYEAVPRPLRVESQRRSPGERGDAAGAVGSPEAQEADLGYGKSHGYATGHGGPTGPGDAPAPESNEPSSSK
jgi:hypothetical protein